MKSVSRILSLRDDLTSLHTLDLYNRCTHDFDFVDPNILKSIVNYAVSHNVQQVQICVTCDIQQLPFCLFSSQTLTSLDLSIHHRILRGNVLFPSSLNLPALTTLSLKGFYFRSGDNGCAEPFSALRKLSNLIIRHFRVLDAQTLCISNTTLVNFTMETYYDYKDICKLELSTPSLTNFAFTGTPNPILSVSHPCSITHLYVNAEDIVIFVKENSAVLLSWLLEFANIKSLTVSSNTLQVLRPLYLYTAVLQLLAFSLFISICLHFSLFISIFF